MQRLLYKDFEFFNTTLDTIINTDDDSDYRYSLVSDIEYVIDLAPLINICKGKKEQLALMPSKKDR